VYWTSSGIGAPGTPSLNLARNSDPQIDKDMSDARVSADPAQRRADYEDVTAQLNKDIPYIWTDAVLWDVVAKPTIEGMLTATVPDGVPQLAPSSGWFNPAQLWIGTSS
jgi:ABC-type transport system substrate-binding protein